MIIQLKTLKNSVQGKRILIDSNIIIYLTEGIEPYFSLSQELFSFIENGDTKAVISVLSIAEVMQGPLRAGKPQLAAEVQNYLINFPNSKCLSVTQEVLQLAGNEKNVNWKLLRVVDSLIIASGLQDNVDLFISNDSHFKKALPSKMILSFDL